MERLTRQRIAIASVIAAARRPLSPQEICDAAQAHVAGLGVATVYRTLKAMIAEGAVRGVELPGEPPRYEPTGLGHHHHFRCDGCARVFDFDACPGGLDALAPKGFVPERHELVLYGKCPECAAHKRGVGSRVRRPRQAPR